MAPAPAPPIPYAELADHLGRAALSDWLTLTQERIDLFAEATDDRQWIHVDVERARREIGGTIAHGYLVLSLVSVLSRGLIEVTGVARRINYGLERVRFTASVRPGQRMRIHQTLLEATRRGEGTQMRSSVSIEIEHEARPTCVAETIILLIPA